MPQNVQNSRPSGLDDTLYNRIVRAVAADIARGSLAPGERLMESRLADRFGVSRAPARQALIEMETLGFVSHADPPARGYRVAAKSAERAAAYAEGTPEPFSMEVTPTWQLIYGDVEEALTKRIAFGSWRLVEVALGQHYGVSRTVAREVLARLQSCGLVVNEGKGWIAPQLNDTRVCDLYDLRALLEPAALAEVGADVPLEILDRMIGDLHAAKSCTPAGATLDTLEADLHFELLRGCKNTLLRKAMIESQSLVLAHRYLYKRTAEIFPVEPFLNEHLDILEKLRSGAVAEAGEALRRHLIASSDRAVVRIAKIRGSFQDNSLVYLEPIETPKR